MFGAAVGGNILVPISRAADAHREMFLALAEVEFRLRPDAGSRALVATGRQASHAHYQALRGDAAGRENATGVGATRVGP
jgi:hypothetical protein